MELIPLLLQICKQQRATQHSGSWDRHAEMLIDGVGWSSPARYIPRKPPAGGILAPLADLHAHNKFSSLPALQQGAISTDLPNSSTAGVDS